MHQYLPVQCHEGRLLKVLNHLLDTQIICLGQNLLILNSIEITV